MQKPIAPTCAVVSGRPRRYATAAAMSPTIRRRGARIRRIIRLDITERWGPPSRKYRSTASARSPAPPAARRRRGCGRSRPRPRGPRRSRGGAAHRRGARGGIRSARRRARHDVTVSAASPRRWSRSPGTPSGLGRTSTIATAALPSGRQLRRPSLLFRRVELAQAAAHTAPGCGEFPSSRASSPARRRTRSSWRSRCPRTLRAAPRRASSIALLCKGGPYLGARLLGGQQLA